MFEPRRLRAGRARLPGAAAVGALVLQLAACAASGPAPGEAFPLVDAHGHFGGSFEPAALVRTMDESGVSKQIVMARYYPGPAGPLDLPGNDDMALRLAETYPGRFYPLVGMQRPLLTGADKWTAPDAAVEALLRDTERKLASGKFYGIGELIVRHWAYSPGRHAEQDNPIDSALTRRLSALAARFDVPLVFHMEGYPARVAELSQLMSAHPRTRYVWAHNCGRSTAAVIRSLMSRFANLYCDLGGMTHTGTGYGSGWPRSEAFTSLIESDGVLFPEMASLYEEFSDRFMIGMDVAHAQALRHYARRAQRFRALLAPLSPPTRARIAGQNAIRVFRLER